MKVIRFFVYLVCAGLTFGVAYLLIEWALAERGYFAIGGEVLLAFVIGFGLFYIGDRIGKEIAE